MQKLRALIDENAERESPLGVADVQMTSFIHGYIMMFLVSTDAELWPANTLGAVSARFWLSSDAESLGDYQEAALASLRNGSSLRAVRMGVSGGVAGRVMAFAAGQRFTEKTE